MFQTYENGKWKNVIKRLELEDICLHYQNMPNIFTWFLKVENIFLQWLEKDITRETLERWCTSGLEDRKWTHSHKASKKRQGKGSSLLVIFFFMKRTFEQTIYEKKTLFLAHSCFQSESDGPMLWPERHYYPGGRNVLEHILLPTAARKQGDGTRHAFPGHAASDLLLQWHPTS